MLLTSDRRAPARCPQLAARCQKKERPLSGAPLTFSDDRYTAGYVGYYSEGARVQVENIVFEELEEPRGECYAVGEKKVSG